MSQSLILGKLQMVQDRTLTNKDRCGSAFDIEIVSATSRQTKTAPEAAANIVLYSLRSPAFILRKCTIKDGKCRRIKKQAACTVCDDISYWWNIYKKCRKYVVEKRSSIQNSHRVRDKNTVKQFKDLHKTIGHKTFEKKSLFLSSQSVKLLTDPNPIVDDGPQNSIGGIIEVRRLGDFPGVDFKVDTGLKKYSHGWENNALNTKPIICSWKQFVTDTKEKPTVMKFYFIEGSAFLLVSLDIL